LDGEGIAVLAKAVLANGTMVWLDVPSLAEAEKEALAFSWVGSGVRVRAKMMRDRLLLTLLGVEVTLGCAAAVREIVGGVSSGSTERLTISYKVVFRSLR
jgi:hypothetical protein